MPVARTDIGVRVWGGGARAVPVTPNRLREYRLMTGLGLREFAKETAIDKMSLSKAENQQRDLQDVDKLTILRALRRLLNMPKLTLTDVFFQ